MGDVFRWEAQERTNTKKNYGGRILLLRSWKRVKPYSYGPSYTSYKYYQVIPFIECIIPVIISYN